MVTATASRPLSVIYHYAHAHLIGRSNPLKSSVWRVALQNSILNSPFASTNNKAQNWSTRACKARQTETNNSSTPLFNMAVFFFMKTHLAPLSWSNFFFKYDCILTGGFDSSPPASLLRWTRRGSKLIRVSDHACLPLSANQEAGHGRTHQKNISPIRLRHRAVAPVLFLACPLGDRKSPLGPDFGRAGWLLASEMGWTVCCWRD